MNNKEPLKVLIVCNNAFVKGNGLCTAVNATIRRLKAQGVDARLMASVNADPDGKQPDFPLEHFVFPVFEPLIYANGFRYARADKKKITEAIRWADVVHLEEAFPLEITAANIAREEGKALVGTFHLYTENILANLGIGKWTFVSDIFLNVWRDCVFNKCSIIQCPTEFVKEHLTKHKFTSELRTIPNGIDMVKYPDAEDVVIPDAPVKILCVGRLSNEKDQKTLLEAMRYSHHAKDIQLLFAGRGPYFKKYQRICKKLVKDGVLTHQPSFGFYHRSGLAKLARESYLYIHCAWAEVEGLSCVEALRDGIVPIIAKGELSATSQFALDDRSVYPVHDAKALAEKIDWWIEHPEENEKMRAAYAESAKKYDQELTTKMLIQMYKDAIAR